MATLRDIRRRIGSVKNTQQITRAMKMVSAAKLNRAQTAVKEAQPYAAQLRQMVTTLSKGTSGDDHPLFNTQNQGKTRIILFTSDKGLCGTFNSGLLRALIREMEKSNGPMADPELVVIGRTGNDAMKNSGFLVKEALVNVKPVDIQGEVKIRIQQAAQDFSEGRIGRVFLAYNTFLSPLKQNPTLHQILPIEPAEPSKEGGAKDGEEQTAEYIYEPDRDEILNRLLPHYLENQGFTAMLNTVAGEHGARMVAMEAATKNAGEMIRRLTLQYNRVRQAAITRELIEIINGAQSL
ncbi:MAG: ATP synthase F1 subunit gamma [Deltaproteobacteria bacterium]|nr:ATP synthase F1 subunit gamma [Deltaproteobacteria bacterium]